VESKGQEPCIVTVELSSPDVLHVRWTPGAIVTEADAKALKSRAAELSSGRTLPMLVEMASMKWIDRRATEMFSAPWPLARMALVGASPVDEVIASFYTSRHNHACPTRFFTSIDEAMTWLTGSG
jgi:hypothetical protein